MTAHVATRPDVTAFLDGVRDLVLPELRTVLARLDPRLAAASGERVELLHPALAVLAAEAVGGSGATAVPGAVAVELVHRSLGHDDIEVIDALRSLAFDLLTGRPARMLSAAMRAQSAFLEQPRQGLDEYRATAMAKTGALMSAALAIGAESAGGRPEEIAVLAQVGQHLGVAVQCVDEVPGSRSETLRQEAVRQIDRVGVLLAGLPMPAAVRDQFTALCEALVSRSERR